MFRARLARVSRALAGLTLVFMLGLEYARLMIPYDPWSDEAKEWRHWAVKRGLKPSWWFGATNYYSPMTMEEWKNRTLVWINNTANAMEYDEENAEGVVDESLSKISVGPSAMLKAGTLETFHEIYATLRNANEKRTKELVEGTLKDVTELNKAERIDAMLEGDDADVEYEKPSIELGSHTMDTDEDFDMVWANFEPWDEIGQEMEFDVRLVPRWSEHDKEQDESSL